MRVGAGAHTWVVVTAHTAGAVVTEVLLAESRQALLLGGGVDVRANDEGHNVEEGNPELIG